MKSKVFFILIVCAFQGFGQTLLSIPVDGNNSQVRAINLNENGLMVLDKSSTGVLNITKVDTSLSTIWNTNITIPVKDDFIDHFYDGSFLYLLLAPKNNKSLSIIKISTSFPGYQKFEIPIGGNFEYGFFAANDKALVIGGSLKNDPFIVIMDTFDTTPKFISSGIKGDLDIESIEIEDETILVTFINTLKKKNQLILREYNLDGKVLVSRNIPAQENNVFLSARYFKTGVKPLIVGNFGLGNLSSNGIPSSQGIYILDIEKNDVHYYSFAEFENLFSFLNDRQQDRIKKKVDKKKSKGDEYSFSYRLLITDIQKQGDQTLISGEVFLPEFRSRNYPGFYGLSPYSSMYWGRPFLYRNYLFNNPFYGYNYRSSQVFDGFRYYEGIVFSVSEQGELLWDQGFPYKFLKYYDLESHLHINRDGNITKVIFNNGSLLQVSDLDILGKSTSVTELDPKALSGSTKKAEFTNFDHWYQNVYLNWGVQKSGNANYCFIQKIIP